MSWTGSTAGSTWPPEVPPAHPERPAWSPSPWQPVERPPLPVVPGVAASVAAGDLDDRLLDRRTVLLGGTLDGRSALDVAARLLLLDSEGDSDDPVELHLSAGDGELGPALMLAETLDLLRVPVRVIAAGTVGGPVLAVLVAAPERLASPHCLFRIGAPRGLAVPGAELSTAAEEHQRLLDELTRRLAGGTGQPPARVAEDLRRGRLLDADGAVAYGLVTGTTSRYRS